MTELEQELPRDVAEALDEVGTDMTVTVYTRAIDPVESTVQLSDPQTYTVKASPLAPATERHRNETVVREGESVTYIAGKDAPFIPDIAQEWVIHGLRYTVTDVFTYYAGSLVVAAWRVTLRGGAANGP